MNKGPIPELSSRLKDIAKDLSFLGHTRYPLKKLIQLFPQHQEFIGELEDVTVPFGVNVKAKRLAMDQFLKDLEVAREKSPDDQDILIEEFSSTIE